MKQKSLLAFLCLGLLTIYFACQKDDGIIKDDQNAQQQLPKIETISYDNGNSIFNDLKTQYNLDNYKQSQFTENLYARGTTTDTLGLIIETDIIKQVTKGNYTSYTMKIVHQNDSTVFYNLTIEYKDGASDMFITKYTPTDYWLNNKNEVYEGEVHSRRVNNLEQYTDPEEAYEEGQILGGGLGNPDLGSGVGGGSGNYSTDYPWDCMGTVVVTTELVPYQCGCGDWPWDECDGCGSASPQWPGYDQEILYACEENWETDPYDPGDTDNPGGGGGLDPDPIDDTPITVTIKPKECTERIDGDLDGDCDVDAYELCRLDGYSDDVCSCSTDPNNESTLEDCIFEEVASTALFKKKGEDDESIPVILELVLPCFDTENNQNGYHDVTIYVKQPVPNSTQISTGLGNAGHTFIELTQAVNGDVVRQYIGLYPANDDVSPNNPIVDGIFIDDSEEEYDVSLKVELSPEQFNNIIDYLASFGEINEYGDITNVDPEYDLNEFNCSDFGLDIMNLSDIQIPDSTGEWGGEYGYDLGQGTCPALLGQDIRNTDFGPNVEKDLNGGVSGNSTENLCDD